MVVNYPDYPHVHYYIDKHQRELFTKVKEEVLNGDDDKLFIVCGKEGSGKSKLAELFAYALDPKFDHTSFCYNNLEFFKALLEKPKGSCIVHDEAFRDFSGRNTLTRDGRDLIDALMRVRQKNFIIFLVTPDPRRLAGYIKDLRCDGLFFVYKPGNLDSQKRERIYRTYGKSVTKSVLDAATKPGIGYNAFFKFPYLLNKKLRYAEVIDQTEYRKKKANDLEDTLKRKIQELESRERARIEQLKSGGPTLNPTREHEPVDKKYLKYTKVYYKNDDNLSKGVNDE